MHTKTALSIALLLFILESLSLSLALSLTLTLTLWRLSATPSPPSARTASRTSSRQPWAPLNRTSLAHSQPSHTTSTHTGHALGEHDAELVLACCEVVRLRVAE